MSAYGKKMRILSDQEDFRIVYYPSSNSDIVVVTFDGFDTDISNKGFGTNFCQSLGLGTVYVSQRKTTQYQGLSAEALAEVLNPALEGKKVYTYGVSLGGYCAIYYAGVLGAQAITMSPRNSAHPIIKANDPTSKAQFAYLDFVHCPYDWVKSDKNPIIMVDPHERNDMLFIDECIKKTYPDPNIAYYPFGGHLMAEALLQAKMLKKFFLQALDGIALDMTQFEGETKITKTNKAKFAMSQGDTETAIAILRELFDADHRDQHIAELLLRSLRKSNKLASVDPALFTALDHVDFHKGYFDEAFYLARNKDVRDSKKFQNLAFSHYILHGIFEGRAASTKFDPKIYAKRRPDVIRAGVHPFFHFIWNGQKLGW